MISVSLCVKKHPSQNLDPLIGKLIIKSNVEEKLLIVILHNNRQSLLLYKICRHGTPQPATAHSLQGKHEGEKVGNCSGAAELEEITVQILFLPAASLSPTHLLVWDLLFLSSLFPFPAKKSTYQPHASVKVMLYHQPGRQGQTQTAYL